MKPALKPALLILALSVALAMVRLGVWQLDRAGQKQQVLDQRNKAAKEAPIDLNVWLKNKQSSAETLEKIRFKPVIVTGAYSVEQHIYLDSQVVDTKVGYRVFTPFNISGSDRWVLVDRGWQPAGQSRANLPIFNTAQEEHTLLGRINVAPAKPPLLSDNYQLPISLVWPYISTSVAAQKMHKQLLPWVVELAPKFNGELDQTFKRRWAKIDDKWVATHKAYAVQWFAMAFVFLIACAVLIFRFKHQD